MKKGRLDQVKYVVVYTFSDMDGALYNSFKTLPEALTFLNSIKEEFDNVSVKLFLNNIKN